MSEQIEARPSLARATALMTLGTVLSRATGLARVVAIASALGVVESGRLTDTYNLGNTAPNIIYELILGGVLTSVFVPVFVELREREGHERAWEIASAIINLSLAVLLGMTILGILGAPLLANIYTSRLEGAQSALQHEILTFLLRLFIPQIIFYALAAMTAGLLNSHNRFAVPMYTPILNNITVIAAFIWLREAFGSIDGLAAVTRPQMLLMGLGTTAGVAVMALSQLPALKGLGHYRVTFSADHPSVKKLLRLSVFVIGYVVANQIGYLIVQILANAQTGGYSAYVFAFTFFLLPHGLFAVSLTTALLPSMSEHAVNERWDSFRERLSTGIRSTLFLILPSTVGFLVLGEGIVRVLIEHGVMTETSTRLVAGVLQLFVLGLVPFALFQLFLRAFYALQDTKTPFLINCAAVALNIAINIPMFNLLGVRGLAAGHASAYVFGVILQARALRRRIGGLDGSRVLASSMRMAAATLGMGALVWAVATAMPSGAGAGWVGEALALAVPISVGGASYLVLSHVLRVPELEFVKGLLRRRNPV
ncbi:MAG TPA: murein biosynthesis integral membrane protein MurJ [Actinomycetota bacterium]|nr:murein biosynthesis integral membrane protein MurJ [Actinomycetota bacterium]